jgi:hypothetical protein
MRSYEHEKEIRAIIQDINFHKQTLAEAESNPTGKLIKVDLTKLVECIYVDPYCPEWFFSIVKGICSKYELNVEIRKSDLAKDPIF